MAGGKRKFLNKKTRNKRQNEIENTEENPPVRSLRDSSALEKKQKLEETNENEEKRPLPVQVDLTTEPATSIKPKKDDDVSKKASKYVPPFSRTRKSGNTEEESGSKSPVTRSSTRKRNLLQVLADVAKHKLEFEDRNDETSSLGRSEKRAETCPSNDNEKEQEIVETQPAKLPKLRERIRINRQFSLNLRSKGKKKTKQSESEPEGEEKLDENASLAKTLEEHERQDTKAVEIHYGKKRQQAAEKASKDEAKQNECELEGKEVDGHTTIAETLGDNDSQETKDVEKHNKDKHYKTAEEASKDEAEQNECKREGKEVDGHTTMAETLGDNDSQETKDVEKHNEDKHYKTAEQASKDESSKIPIKENKLKRVPNEDIPPTYHTIDDNNEVEHSRCGRDSKMGSKKEKPSDSMINNNTKMLHVDVVVQACVDYLIQTVEAGFLVDVVASDNKELVLDPSTKKEGHVDKGLTIPQADNDDGCTKISGNLINIKSTINDEKPNLETPKPMITRSNETDHPYINVIGDGVDSNLRKLEGEAIDDMTDHGDTEVTSNNDEQHKEELETGVPKVDETDPLNIDVTGDNHNDGYHKKELDTINNAGDSSKSDHSGIENVDDGDEGELLNTEMHDDSKMGHPGDIDVVGDDDKNDEEVLGREMHDDSKIGHPGDIDVVGDEDKNDEEVLGREMHDDSKIGHPGDIDVVDDDDKNDEEVLGREMHDDSKMGHPGDIDVVGDDDDKNDEEVLGREMHDDSKMAHSDDIDVGDDDKNDEEVLGREVHDGSKMGHSDDIDVGDDDDKNDEVLGREMHDDCKMGNPCDIDVVGDDDKNDEEVFGSEMHSYSKMECQEDIDVDVVGDGDGDSDNDIDVKGLGDEVYTGSKADLSDNNVTGDEDINIKNLVGDDDHPTVVVNSLQPEHAANVGEVSNVEHSGRNANDSNIPIDIDASLNFNKENHVTVINPHGGENAEKISTKTSPNDETRKSSSKNNTATDIICNTAPSQMDDVTGISSPDGRITSMKEETHGASLEELEVPKVDYVKTLPETLDKDKNEGTNIQEKSEQGKCDKQDKSFIFPEKESSLVNKDCSASGIAVSKCGREMDIDYVIDCTDSQLIGAKPSNVSDGLRYDDFNLEDLMDCTDSQLVDIEDQVSNNQQSERDGTSQGITIEDGTALIQDLIEEMSSIKLYLMDTWNRYEQVMKRRHLAYTPVIKKRM